MADRKLQLPEVRVPGRRLGRNINHDPASLRYRVPVPRHVEPATVVWERFGAIMNQGDLGRCVPTAGTGLLQCAPFWNALEPQMRVNLQQPAFAEQYAIQAYREVTRIDPFEGAWEPDDTGSDGLSLAKLWKQLGLNNGYEHATTVMEAHAAIQKAPFIIGTAWLSGMDQPRTDGTVSVSGTNRGGHEYLCREYDLGRDLWWFDNSWGTSFGVRGRFAYDTPGLQKMMAMQGDITSMVPASAPAPQPTPETPFPAAELDVWARRVTRFPRVKPAYERAAASAYLMWRAGQR